MATVIILLILLVIGIFAVKKYIHNLQSGCCGGGSDTVRRTEAADEDKSHYPYQYDVQVEGMSCRNCANRVANAFNEKEGFCAEVDLKHKLAHVWTKEETEDAVFRVTVTRAGYEFAGVTRIAKTA